MTAKTRIIGNIIAELNPIHTDDILVDMIEDPGYTEEAIEYFLEEYWDKQPNWVKDWTLDLLRDLGDRIDMNDEQLLERLLEERKNEKAKVL